MEVAVNPEQNRKRAVNIPLLKTNTYATSLLLLLFV